jgi:hypothetical protein
MSASPSFWTEPGREKATQRDLASVAYVESAITRDAHGFFRKYLAVVILNECATYRTYNFLRLRLRVPVRTIDEA